MEQNKVERYFKEKNLPYPILYFKESSATVDLAAKALGEEPAKIAKTLAFQAKEKDIVIVMCGTARIDNKKYKSFFHTKAKMLSPEETLDRIGHPVGGICPFALSKEVMVYLDESLKAFSVIYPAAGTPNSAVKMTPKELEDVTGGTWVDVTN